MQITVVTSFSPAGYKLYGQRSIETFLRFWPSSVDLVVYYEGAENALPGVAGVDLLETEPCRTFLERHAGNRFASGRQQRPSDIWKGNAVAAGYNYRFDAYKFSRKVFAIAHAARTREGRLFWIDGDTETIAPVDLRVISALLPDGVSLAHLARPEKYSECGFVGYNLDADGTRDFIDAFEAIYAEDRFIAHREWHDSWLFDRLIDELKPTTLPIPHNRSGSPVEASVLGRFLRHYKGDRKNSPQLIAAQRRTSR